MEASLWELHRCHCPLHAAEGTLFIELRKGTFLKRSDTSLFICCFTVKTELFCHQRSSLTSWQEVQCHGPQHRVAHSFPWTNRRPSLFRVGNLADCCPADSGTGADADAPAGLAPCNPASANQCESGESRNPRG